MGKDNCGAEKSIKLYERSLEEKLVCGIRVDNIFRQGVIRGQEISCFHEGLQKTRKMCVTAKDTDI